MPRTPEAPATPVRTPMWIGPAICALIVVVAIFSTTQFRAIEVVVGGAIDLFHLALWLAGGWGLGSLILSRLMRSHDPLLRHVTACGVGIGLMGVVFQLLGLAGALSAITIAIVVVGGIVAGAFTLRTKASKPDPKPRGPGEMTVHLVGWALIALPLAIAIIAASVAPGVLWNPLDPHPYDVTSYHLEVAREWYEAGRIVPLAHNAFSFFPMLMETHFLAAMHVRGGPWDAMYLCQFISLAHGALTVLAVFASVRTLWATPLLAWAAAIFCATTPWMIMLSGVCYVETGVMLYTTLACGWIVLGTSWRTALIVGACLGLACGMKYTAFAMTGTALLGAWLIGAKPTKQRVAQIVIAGAVMVLVASPWLIRNLAWTGNPVFPIATGVFGRRHFSEEQVERYQVAHRPPEKEASAGSRLTIGAGRTLGDIQFGYVLLPLAIVGGAIVFVRWKDGRVLVLGMIGMTLVWLFATHVMPRFLTPLIPLAAIVIAGAVAALPKKLLAGATSALLMLVLLQAGLGVAWTAKILLPKIEGAGVGFVRLENFDPIVPEAIVTIRQTNGKLALVGDAKAFFYRMPSDRLLYRTVFDVRGEGWLGTPIDELRRRGYWVLVDPPELQRLAATYRHITPDPVEPAMPYLLPPLK